MPKKIIEIQVSDEDFQILKYINDKEVMYTSFYDMFEVDENDKKIRDIPSSEKFNLRNLTSMGLIIDCWSEQSGISTITLSNIGRLVL